MMSLWQFAAAQSGDLQQFYAIGEKCRAVIPGEYARVQTQVDAVEAYALAKNKQPDKARELIDKWKSDVDIVDRLSRYWAHYPGGSNVVKNWKDATS